MRLYGLALYTVDEIIEWYARREEAEEEVALVLRDAAWIALISSVVTEGMSREECLS